MITLNDLLDLAKKRADLPSDRALTHALDLTGSHVSFYRSGRSFPTAAVILKLAELAELDPSEALIMLNIWREKSPVARRQWEKMLATISAAAAALLITAYSPAALSGQAEAATEYKLESPLTKYYEKKWMG